MLRTSFALCAAAFLFACSQPSLTPETTESDLTGDGGAPGDTTAGDTTAAEAGATALAAYGPEDIGETPKLRFSIDGAAVTEAVEVSWTTAISGTPRRYALQGLTPAPGGRPAVYAEFGEGQAPIATGTYDCAGGSAIVVLIEADQKLMTAVNDGPQRACTVTIDEAELQDYGDAKIRVRHVLGHIEADVGQRVDASSATKHVRAAFAARVIEGS